MTNKANNYEIKSLKWTNVNTIHIKQDIRNDVENKHISGNRRESHHSEVSQLWTQTVSESLTNSKN